ncbi:MAG: hypothetical protein GKR99_09320 [Rhodobacteraceae bacterium]|nr:hypothetical protein [Paracoccaceae bacterium]
MIFEDVSSIFAPTRANPVSQPPACQFDVQAQTRTGEIKFVTKTAPASDQFLRAFAVIGRGTVLETRRGVVAVEDLMPGDRVMTASGRAEILNWCGSVTLDPARLPGFGLVRVPVDAYGPGRPATDTVFGPGAMRVHRSPAVCARLRASAVLSPLVECADEGAMIPIAPTAPVTFFQLGFSRQTGLNVGGMEVASLFAAQPGLDQIIPAIRAPYLSMFPQYQNVGAAGRAMGPTLSRAEIDQLAA